VSWLSQIGGVAALPGVIWGAAKQFATLPLFGTLMGAAVGVLAGAWLTGRRESKRALVDELNGVRAAMTLCFTISNRFISLKEQHVQPLTVEYEHFGQQYKAFLRQRGTPGTQTQFSVKADLRTVTPLRVPTELLERYVFEKTLVDIQALAAAVDLVGAIDSLENSMKFRNDLIAEIRASNLAGVALTETLLGLRNSQGVMMTGTARSSSRFPFTPTTVFISRRF
jgi:hypothetical protein